MRKEFGTSTKRGGSSKQEAPHFEAETQLESFQQLEETLAKLSHKIEENGKMEKDSEIVTALLARIENYKKMFKQRLSAYVDNVVTKNGRNVNTTTLWEFDNANLRVYRIGEFIPVTFTVKEIKGEKMGGGFVSLESGLMMHYENDEEKKLAQTKVERGEQLDREDEKRMDIKTDESIQRYEVLDKALSNEGFEVFCRSLGILKQGETLDSLMNQLNGEQRGFHIDITKSKEFKTNIPGVTLWINVEFGRNKNIKIEEIKLQIIKDGLDAVARKQLFERFLAESGKRIPNEEVDL